MDRKYDFVFGAQYYRAPTPSPENWESDLKNMHELGFTHVKFWVQWRWTHRKENEFYFEDTDRLMDLAHQNGLKVTINVIFDVAPQWLFEKYPDAKMVLANGKTVEPMAVGYRQIGGFPGPCYNHPQAKEARMNFLQKTVERYKNHPALDMWDIWNEPEQCGTHRTPESGKTSCYCKNCKMGFAGWLKDKYGTIDILNQTWGRCYESFEKAELPLEKFCFADFIDFHSFHSEKMTDEAKCRIEVVEAIDKVHPVYLHVVPGTVSSFNPITGANDYDMARQCREIYASTTFPRPVASILTVSAAEGKLCYNVESHIGNGSTKMHQKQITLRDMANDFVPQIGMGIRGFLFWQYRSETLGLESPAWGVTQLDGSVGSIGRAAKTFISKLDCIKDELMKIGAPKAEIAIWKGLKNEFLSFCIHETLEGIGKTIETYSNGFYYNNFNCMIADDKQLQKGIDGIKLLVLPYCYGMDKSTAEAVDKYVQHGGCVLCEAHLGAYDADKGRHSYHMPGFELDEKWNIRESYTTSSFYLHVEKDGELDTKGLNDDMKKALASYGVDGGKYFGIMLENGGIVTGAERFACLEAKDAKVLGIFNGEPCIIKQRVGKGTVYYCGTNLGEGAQKELNGFERFITSVAEECGVSRNPYSDVRGVHVDVLSDEIFTVTNTTDCAVTLSVHDNDYKGLLFGAETKDGKITIDAKTSEIFKK